MIDIVDRLLQFDNDGYTRFRGLTISEEAATEITTLRAENERLREALAGMIKYGHETRGIRVLEAFNKAKEALK